MGIACFPCACPACEITVAVAATGGCSELSLGVNVSRNGSLSLC